MPISTKSKTIELLNKYNLKAKKNLGQNFLIDSNIVTKICNLTNLDSGTLVLEIGPGLGAMTEELLKYCQVLCYEIDKEMVEILKNELPSKSLKILNRDFLQSNCESDINSFKDIKKVKVVSNLPYYITTPIIFKLLEIKKIDEIIIMVQKEVGERLVAKPSTKEYGSLSVAIKYLTNCSIQFEVSRNCFYPVPNVDSQIILMKRKETELEQNFTAIFLEFVQSIFMMRRKTLINNLLSKYQCSRIEVEGILTDLGFNLQVRSESLELEEIIKLFKAFKPFI